MSDSQTPTPHVARSSTGNTFAKVFDLPDGGNAAFYQGKDEGGQPCVNILMSAYGVQSLTQASGLATDEVTSKLIDLIDQDKCEEIYLSLRQSIAKAAPKIVSVFEMNQLMAGFGILPSMTRGVGKICQRDGNDFLALRLEEKQENDQSRSCIFVLGSEVSKSFYYPDYHLRDSVYEKPERLAPLIEQVATQQLGNQITTKSTTRPRLP